MPFPDGDAMSMPASPTRDRGGRQQKGDGRGRQEAQRGHPGARAGWTPTRQEHRLQSEVEAANLLEALADILPVHHLPEGLHPIPLHVLVLHVVGMLTHVEHEERHGAVPDVAWWSYTFVTLR